MTESISNIMCLEMPCKSIYVRHLVVLQIVEDLYMDVGKL